MKVTVIPIVIGKGNGRLGNKRTSGDHPEPARLKSTRI